MPGEWRKSAAVGVLAWATRLYPAERREWGEAILAEADELEAGRAWSWMLGGLLVALRAFFSALWRRRAATAEPGLAGPAGPPPLLPWKAAFLCLAIAGGLFFLPEMRQGVGTTIAAWQDIRRPAAEWEEMGREAERRGDAQGMAFAAMRLPGDEGVGLAERAVARDPGLTWALYFVERRGAQSFRPRPHPELLQRVERWDAENAVPYLAEAQETSPASLSPPLRRDPRWRPLMDRAFAAPRFDDYITRRVELDREVMRRWQRANPVDALTTLLSLPFPSLKDLQDYSALRLAEGAEAERAGNWEQAASHYWVLAHFGQRMRLGGETDLEQAEAAHLQKVAFQRLEPVLLRLGRTQEAQAAAYEAQMPAPVRAISLMQFETLRSSAWLVHGAALLVLLSLLALGAALAGWIAGWRRSRWVQAVLRCAPPLVLAGCVLLAAAYYPYARIFSAYLNAPGAPSPRALWSFLNLWSLPQELRAEVLRSHRGEVGLWWTVIALGGASCAWRLARALRPARPFPAD